MQLNEIEQRLQSSKQALAELGYKKKSTQEKIAGLQTELGNFTPQQLELQKAELFKEEEALLRRAIELSTAINPLLMK